MAAAGKETIHFIITGGTIDSYYNGAKDTVFPRGESIIPSYVTNLKLSVKTVFTKVCMKDSRELTTNDRKKILLVIEKSPHSKFIITHGTYTMPDTARFIDAHLKRKGAAIIFTGPMVPLEGFTGSDGGFNLGFSVAKALDLKSGIFVCMNGAMLEPQAVQAPAHERTHGERERHRP